MSKQPLIICNGSKWAGESPDPLESFIYNLKNYMLDPCHEEYGFYDLVVADEYLTGRVPEEFKGYSYHFSGNFFTLSACFSIYIADRETAYMLASLIYDNVMGDEYRRFVRENGARQRQLDALIPNRIEYTDASTRNHYSNLIHERAICRRFNGRTFL